MKKNSLRVSALVLACVPLLLGSTTLVNAEEATKDTTETVLKADAADETVKEDEVTAADKDKADEATKKFTLSVKDSEIKTTIGKSGQLTIDEKIDGKNITGIFAIIKGKEPKSVDVFKDGKWTAKALGVNEEVNLMFTPDEASKKLLEGKYKDQDFSKPVALKSVKFSVAEKIIDPIEDKKQDLELTLKVSTDKDNKGKITVDYKGAALNADFDVLDSKDGKIKLSKDGSFEILENGIKEKTFTQEVSFKLIKDKNFDAIANSDEFKGKEIKLDYKQKVDITASPVKKVAKDIKLTFKTSTLKADFKNAIPDKPWNEGTGNLEINDFEGIKIKGTYTAIKDNPYISLEADGRWNALKPGKGDFTPGFEISKESKEALQKKYPNNDLNITVDKINVDFVDTTNSGNGNTGTPGGKTAKDYVPVNKLPQTGEEKMKFAGVIGAVVIVIAGVIFFMKKKKGSDDTEA